MCSLSGRGAPAGFRECCSEVSPKVHSIIRPSRSSWSGEAVVRTRSRVPENPGATSLRRVLGLTEVTAGGVGIIIGAGIYVLLGAATAHAGALVWLAFLLAAAMSALTGC